MTQRCEMGGERHGNAPALLCLRTGQDGRTLARFEEILLYIFGFNDSTKPK